MARSFSFTDDGTEPRANGEPRRRVAKPKASEKLETWPPPALEKTEDDDLLKTAEQAVTILLTSELDAKDMNAAIANAIRLIQVKHRISPEGEPSRSWFGGDGDDDG